MKFGLEIHQRLDTKKLFCSCKGAVVEKRAGDKVITRKLHPVFSELGEVDQTSRDQHKKDLSFEYHYFNDINCLVEIDEEPPHEVDKEALLVSLGMCFHLNAKTVDEVHVMRKIIIDGSNTSGFQRTMIIALNGYLETSKGKVRITQIALEEESSSIVENKNDKVVYNLDRLGVPLIEITTAPDIKDPEHLLEVAQTIGMMLRATGKVARGIGTIRQDVNVSTEGGARVEIKGAQELKQLPELVENELKRQNEMIKLFEELKKPSIKFLYEYFDATSFFNSSTTPFISSALKKGEKAIAIILPNHNGFLGRELLPNRRYGTELSEYAKTVGVAGIIHSDEDFTKYGLDSSIKEKIRAHLKCSAHDAFAIVISSEQKAKFALEKVFQRAERMEVLQETRKANADGTTSYMRPISGGARMYPETDVPSIVLDSTIINEAKEAMGENLEQKKEKLMLLLNNKEMAEK
ncbi:MAG: Glu-tRNA(Gln) amidotransferase subunit GatE, partial [Candidatus Micrarchaeota archaeon]